MHIGFQGLQMEHFFIHAKCNNKKKFIVVQFKPR